MYFPAWTPSNVRGFAVQEAGIKEPPTEETKGQLVVRAIDAGMSPESTACAEQFIKGVVEAYSWSVKTSRIAEGIIEMQLSKDRRSA